MELKPAGITKTHLALANIGEDYWENDFSNYKGPSDAAKASIKYLKSLKVMKEQGVGLLYVGPNGLGKTTLAMIVLKYLSRHGWDVYATSLGEIIERTQKSWRRDSVDSSEIGIIDRCREVDFLFIDDLGKEHRGQSGFVQTVLDNLIRFRIQHRKPTLLTTNLTKSEIESTYGESVISLLEGRVLPITVNGKDFRRTQQKPSIRQFLSE